MKAWRKDTHLKFTYKRRYVISDKIEPGTRDNRRKDIALLMPRVQRVSNSLRA